MDLTDEQAFEEYHQADKELVLNPTEFIIALRYYLAGCAHRKKKDTATVRGLFFKGRSFLLSRSWRVGHDSAIKEAAKAIEELE